MEAKAESQDSGCGSVTANRSKADELELLAERLIAKYPGGYCSEIEVGFPCKMAIRSPLRGLDTPKVILEGSYMDLRSFEIVYDRLKMFEEDQSPIDRIM
jgi:hypothetical protein